MGEPLSRREFIKGTAAVVGSIVASSHVPPEWVVSAQGAATEGEKGTRAFWERTKFFDRLSGYDGEMKRRVRDGLSDFEHEFAGEIEENSPQTRFDRAAWRENLEKAMSVMDRIKSVYDRLEESGELPEDGKKLLEADFYKTASPLWAILRTAEKYKHKKEEFIDILNNSEQLRDMGFSDPLLGDEIFTIKTKWAENKYGWIAGGESKVVQLFYAGGDYNLAPIIENKWWKEEKGPGALFAYKADPGNPDRAAPFDIEVSDNPEMIGKIEEILKAEKLDRVGISFSVLNDPAAWSEASGQGEVDTTDWGGVYWLDENENEHSRTIKMYVPDGLTEEKLKEFEFLTHAITIHEAGHAMVALVPAINDDVKVFKNRLAIDRIIKWFKPGNDIKKFFKPKGQFYEGREIVNGEITMPMWNERYGIVNMATVTDYAAWKFSSDDLSRAKEVLYTSAALRKGVTSEQATWWEFPSPLRRLIEPVVKEFPDLSLEPSFKEFWRNFKAVLRESDTYTTNFEKFVLAEIDKNIALFDSPERQEYFFRQDWFTYLDGVVFPMAALERYKYDPELFKELLIRDIRNPTAAKSIEQSIDVVFNSVLGEDGNTLGSSSDEELFAEIVAYNHLRKIDGVNNQISLSIWESVQKRLDSLLADLVSDGLAVRPKGLLV